MARSRSREVRGTGKKTADLQGPLAMARPGPEPGTPIFRGSRCVDVCSGKTCTEVFTSCDPDAMPSVSACYARVWDSVAASKSQCAAGSRDPVVQPSYSECPLVDSARVAGDRATSDLDAACATLESQTGSERHATSGSTAALHGGCCRSRSADDCI